MKNINNTSKLVEKILREKPDTRNSDDLLYLEVCERVNPFTAFCPFSSVFTQREEFKLPSYKSVERCRRKLQREHPELMSDKAVQGFRRENEHIVRAYAKE